MASLSSVFINYPPILMVLITTYFSFWKYMVKSYVEFIDFDLRDIITYVPFVLAWIKMRVPLLSGQNKNWIEMGKRGLRKVRRFYVYYNVIYITIFLTVYVVMRQPMNCEENLYFCTNIRMKNISFGKKWTICLTISMTKRNQSSLPNGKWTS